jgi:hypothetical protein
LPNKARPASRLPPTVSAVEDVDEAVMARLLPVAGTPHREVMVRDVDKAPVAETRVAADVELHRRWRSNR